MSGGVFNYAYGRVTAFADDLENRIAEDELDEVPRDTEVTARLTRLVREARRLAALMKEAEWFYSDDIEEETFMKRVAQIEADHAG